jgi:hypothetical protein
MGDMMTVWLNYGGVARAADGGQREEDENRREVRASRVLEI